MSEPIDTATAKVAAAQESPTTALSPQARGMRAQSVAGNSDTGSPIFLRDRSSEEPLGRWMNRCEYAAEFGVFQLVVCDRKIGHLGRHQGRLFSTNKVRVIGWYVVR